MALEDDDTDKPTDHLHDMGHGGVRGCEAAEAAAAKRNFLLCFLR